MNMSLNNKRKKNTHSKKINNTNTKITNSTEKGRKEEKIQRNRTHEPEIMCSRFGCTSQPHRCMNPKRKPKKNYIK